MAHENAKIVGRRLSAVLLDDLSKQVPDGKYCLLPKGREVSDGFREVTFGDLAQAVNYTSWWIERTFGRVSSPETVSYMAVNDIRYCIFVLACQKTGYRAFLPSTRNSDDALLHLLNAVDCKKFVYGLERKNRALDFQKLKPTLQLVEIPSLSEMMDVATPPYRYEKTYQEEEDSVPLIIHSSGTTGLPKPIFLTNGYISVLDRSVSISHLGGGRGDHWANLGPDDLLLSTAPFFHIMGIASLFMSLFRNIPFVTPPDRPLSPDLLVDVILATKPTVTLIPPSVLEEMSKSDRALLAISHLNRLLFAGAPLAPEIGQKLSKLTDLRSVYGSSEAGAIPTLQPSSREDWMYFEWDLLSGADMRPAGGNMYELVLTRTPTRDFQGIFHAFPDLKEYHTKDVFIAHPTNPNKWMYHGRIDDVVVLSNGEKFNPVTMEKVIEGHPLVSYACITGQGRFQSALLVEPNWNNWSEDRSEIEFVDVIWPVVQQANKIGPAHARIHKSKIGLASKAKPFQTTPKGTIQRRHILRVYEAEIDAIYRKNDIDEGFLSHLQGSFDLAGIKSYVEKVVSTLVGSEIGEKQDFYSAGLDSLQTIQLTKILQNAIRTRYGDAKCEATTTQGVYANPTIEQLSLFIHRIINGEVIELVNEPSRVEKIDLLVRKYIADIPVRKLDTPSISGAHTVILTGSTGSIGSYLLHALMNDRTTAKVYCLNRAADAQSRQKKTFNEKGLSWDRSREGKVEFLQASFGASKFGLDNRKYDEMIQSVDTILHNAWKVDFNHSVSSFEGTHIRGVRHFVDFSLQSAHGAHIYFVSSISTMGAWKPMHGHSVPEEPVENPDVTLAQGYAESKHVSERICLAASRHAGVPTTILRVGQVGGPRLEKGSWNRTDWLPTIIATSKTTGGIPKDLGPLPVDWIPVDTLATIIVELIDSRRKSQLEKRCAAFNLINPSTTSWASLIPAVQRHYQVKPVELATWVHNLEQIKDPSEDEVIAMPALKLLDFYRGLLPGKGEQSCPAEIQRAMEASATMRNLGPVDGPLMENWLRQWAF